MTAASHRPERTGVRRRAWPAFLAIALAVLLVVAPRALDSPFSVATIDVIAVADGDIELSEDPFAGGPPQRELLVSYYDTDRVVFLTRDGAVVRVAPRPPGSLVGDRFLLAPVPGTRGYVIQDSVGALRGVVRSEGRPQIIGDRIVFSSPDGTIAGYDPDGVHLWSVDRPAPIAFLQAGAERVLAAYADGSVSVLGDQVTRVQVEPPVYSLFDEGESLFVLHGFPLQRVTALRTSALPGDATRVYGDLPIDRADRGAAILAPVGDGGLLLFDATGVRRIDLGIGFGRVYPLPGSARSAIRVPPTVNVAVVADSSSDESAEIIVLLDVFGRPHLSLSTSGPVRRVWAVNTQLAVATDQGVLFLGFDRQKLP